MCENCMFICFDSDCFTIFFVLFKTHLICFLGKNEFSPEEDAHVIGDCIKVYIWQVLVTISQKGMLFTDVCLVFL